MRTIVHSWRAKGPRAENLVVDGDGLSARDALHVAVMRRHGVRRLVSFDRGFDAVKGVERIRA